MLHAASHLVTHSTCRTFWLAWLAGAWFVVACPLVTFEHEQCLLVGDINSGHGPELVGRPAPTIDQAELSRRHGAEVVASWRGLSSSLFVLPKPTAPGRKARLADCRCCGSSLKKSLQQECVRLQI